MEIDLSRQSVIKLFTARSCAVKCFATTSNYLTVYSKLYAVSSQNNWYLVRAVWQHCLLHVSSAQWDHERAKHYLTLIKNIAQVKSITS